MKRNSRQGRTSALWGLDHRKGQCNGKSDPPPSPDYGAAATAQGGANMQTAIANNIMNRPNEVTPYGTRKWTQTGSQRIGDYDVPQFESSIDFTPEGKQLFDKGTALQNGMMDLGGSSLQQTVDALGQPLDISKNRDAMVDSMYRRSTRLLDPQYAMAEDKQRSDLANRGFSVGDEGYNRAQESFNRSKDAAYANARDTANTEGAKQAIQEALVQRSTPLAELNALRTGAMPQSPSFQAYSSSSAQPAPIFAGAQAGGNAALTNYGIESQNDNNTMQGLMKLGSMFGMAAFSDVRLKSNIEKVGELSDGLGVYEYDKFGRRERGVMAQEVQQVKPHAVFADPESGFLKVDYSKLERS